MILNRLSNPIKFGFDNVKKDIRVISTGFFLKEILLQQEICGTRFIKDVY